MSFSVANPIPHYAEEGKEAVFTLELESAGALVEATAASMSVLDEYGATLMAAVVSIAGGVPSATLNATLVAQLDFQKEPYKARWKITVAGVESTHTHELYVVRETYRPSVTVGQLLKRRQKLADQVKDGATGLQGYIDQCVVEFEQRLLGQGMRASLVWDRHAVARWERAYVYALAYRDIASMNADAVSWDEHARREEAEELKIWGNLEFRYDRNNDGVHGSKERQRARGGPLRLSGTPSMDRW